MGVACYYIFLEAELFETRYSKLKRLLYPPQPSLACLVCRFRNALEETLSKRIAFNTTAADQVAILK